MRLRATLNIHSLRRNSKSEMYRTLLAAALLPLAIGDYSYSYDAPTMAPTVSAAPTRTRYA